MSAPAKTRRSARLSIRAGRLLTLTFTTGLLLCGITTPPAPAETPITAQALADDGSFLPYAPVPPQRAGLCLVDTGVWINPDTESAVIYRTAIDGGTGDDVSPNMHGTVLAMMAGAPSNEWGMIGTAPGSIQIVSIRILQPGQTTFPFSAYATGINLCLQLRKRYDIKVINLSLGNPEVPSGQAYETVKNAIEKARGYSLSVVAAAGNDDGGSVEYPAAYPGVISVGATDTQNGALCAFSNRGGLRLLAPGCDLDGADPNSGVASYNYWQGTSESSAIAAAALTALDSYDPTVTAQTAEQYLMAAHDGTLDIARAFRDAGLEQVMQAGEAAEPRTPQAHSTPPAGISPGHMGPSNSMALTAAFPRPRARLIRWTKQRLVLAVEDRPREAWTLVRYLARQAHSQRLRLLRTVRSRHARIAVPKSTVRVLVSYIDPYDDQRASPQTIIEIPQRHSYPRGRRQQ